MDQAELLALRFRLQALTIDFWHDVDMHGGKAAASYYTEDATFATSVREYQGRQAIQAFYESRRTRGARVSLHVVQNFRIELASADEVRCQYILSLFAADGEPVLPSRPAIMMAIANEAVVRQPDGQWLFSSRRLQPLFRDETPTTG